MDVLREKLLSLLPQDRQAKLRKEIETLSGLDLPAMSDAGLTELYTACADEIHRRETLSR